MLEVTPLSRRVIGFAIEVHRQLGPGLYESAYRQCLTYELKTAGVPYESEVRVPIRYRNATIDAAYRADLIVSQELIVEIKSIEQLLPVHTAQLLTYVQLADVPQGLLMNFNCAILRHGLRSVFNRRKRPSTVVPFDPSAP